MDFTDILYEKRAGAARITFNRPEKHNALRIRTYEEIIAALEDCGKDDGVGLVVLTGSGRKAFCAGGDLEMAKALDDVGAMRVHHFDRMLRVSSLILALDKPVLCAVNGLSVGAGAEIVCFCDLVIAADNASFVYNGTRLGGCSWWGSPQLLPLLVGLRKAQEILFSGEPVGAAEAERIGLIGAMVPAEDLAGEIERRSERLLDLSPTGLRMTKAGIRSTMELSLAPLSSAAEANAFVQVGPESRAAFEAFLARRKVDWRSFRRN